MVTNYKEQRVGYYKVLIGLLVLTTVTFIQPHMFLTGHIFGVQLLIGLAKAWIILMYYMHLKGETLIGWTIVFAISLVAFFFVVVTIDVSHFQFKDASFITEQQTSVGATHHTSHAE
ncbi:MAG: cytochrome C oxidase subunit IV family protein [Sulfurimonas sp.]